MSKNEWLSRYGARRKAIDRALLAECERAMGLEEKSAPQQPKTETPPSAVNYEANRAAIAKAFDLLNQGNWGKPINRDKS